MKLPKLPAAVTRLHLSLRWRLCVVLGLLMLMLVGGTTFADHAIRAQTAALRQIYQMEMVPSQLVSQINSTSLLAFVTLSEAVDNIGKPALVREKLADFQKYDELTATLTKQFLATPRSAAVQAPFAKYQMSDSAYQSGVTDLMGALEQGDDGSRDVLQLAVRPFLVSRNKLLSSVVALQAAEAKQMYETQLTRLRQIRLTSVLVLLLGLLVALIMAISLSRSVLGTLAYAGRVAREIAQGRLGHDIRVTRRDELGDLLDAFRTMDGRLSEIVSEVRHGSSEVSTASQQIARGSDDLSQRTQEQASSLEETASSMEEMTSTVKQNAENASHANRLARGAREQAERGGVVVGEAVTAMREIDAASGRIADIVSLIDEIAFQTNLLALNAAVEAARAGEQGRGFAVVATEVRHLAQRSAAAAKEIKGLIKDSTAKVQAGSSLVDQTGKALTEIVQSVNEVTDIVAEIAAASHEQSSGIEQVNHAVLLMDAMTQQNAALVEEAAAAARAMHEQAGELTRQVGFFQLDQCSHSPMPPAAGTAAMAAEAVFAQVRQAPAHSSAEVVSADADADIWKEF